MAAPDLRHDERHLFDRAGLRRHRARARAQFAAHDFLFREAADRLADRLLDCKRDFPLALDLSGHRGLLAPLLHGRSGIRHLVEAASLPPHPEATPASGLNLLRLVAEDEFLPFAPHRFDLVMSVLALHWANDLPGALAQMRRTLKPDGLLLVSLLGGETLTELRQSLLAAEAEIEGGASPRVSPFARLVDAAALLQRAGLALPVADAEQIRVTYADPLSLLRDLRFMGESNAQAPRRKSFTRRATLMRALEIYRERFALADGRVPATFEILTLTGWAPDASQPQPARRGSGQVSLAKVLAATGEDEKTGEPER